MVFRLSQPRDFSKQQKPHHHPHHAPHTHSQPRCSAFPLSSLLLLCISPSLTIIAVRICVCNQTIEDISAFTPAGNWLRNKWRLHHAASRRISCSEVLTTTTTTHEIGSKAKPPCILITPTPTTPTCNINVCLHPISQLDLLFLLLPLPTPSFFLFFIIVNFIYNSFTPSSFPTPSTHDNPVHPPLLTSFILTISS